MKGVGPVVEAPRLVCADDPIDEAGALLADAVEVVDRSRGATRLAIPGGSALAALGAARRRLGDAWSRVLLTWVDERCVALAHEESNRGAAYRAGFLGRSPLRRGSFRSSSTASGVKKPRPGWSPVSGRSSKAPSTCCSWEWAGTDTWRRSFRAGRRRPARAWPWWHRVPSRRRNASRSPARCSSPPAARFWSRRVKRSAKLLTGSWRGTRRCRRRGFPVSSW